MQSATGVWLMSEQRIGSGTASRTSDVMSAVEFQEELRRYGRFNLRPPVENPLAATVQKINDNPAFTQSRLLSRILTALTYERGEFRRAEAAALDAPTLAIAIALMNAARAGTPARDDWIKAVTACDAALATTAA
jgi:hypothetical protein